MDAETPRITSAIPVRRKAVIAWCEALLGIADRLESPAAVNPRGVARVLTLLTDGGGPLYTPAAECSLEQAVWWIADGLPQCPPHDWGCPVIMKLDPAHVAWTCARCGATTVSGDLAERPA
jgi:hypothetical protein